MTTPTNTTKSVELYTLASEQSGSPLAQYKLGFLYGTNYGSAFPSLGQEGKSQQGSVSPYFLSLSFSVKLGLVVRETDFEKAND